MIGSGQLESAHPSGDEEVEEAMELSKKPVGALNHMSKNTYQRDKVCVYIRRKKETDNE